MRHRAARALLRLFARVLPGLFSRALTTAALLALCALALSACADTIQDQPIARSALEPLILTHNYPVYWVGGVFRRLAITEAARDPGGAYTIRYGDCIVAGQYTCLTPLAIVTSPDNSFVPGASAARHTVAVRGVRGVLAQRGATIEVPTSGVVVSIYAATPALAREAVLTMVPINRVGIPDEALPPPLADTGFGSEPLASQKPQGVRLPGTRGTGSGGTLGAPRAATRPAAGARR